MKKILCVEDNDDNVYVLRRRLERAGYAVVVATDGRSGLALAEQEKPDLVLMDLSLPEMDGWETTRRLKAISATAGIPVVALSSHAMAGDRERALDAGCDDYHTKPVDFQRLFATMRRLLGPGVDS